MLIKKPINLYRLLKQNQHERSRLILIGYLWKPHVINTGGKIQLRTEVISPADIEGIFFRSIYTVYVFKNIHACINRPYKTSIQGQLGIERSPPVLLDARAERSQHSWPQLLSKF